MFVPYHDKIVIEPVERTEGVILEAGAKYEEKGIVIAVGEDVTFVEVGDTLLFTAHGVWETAKVDGKVYHVVADNSEYILGKIPHVAEESV